MTSYRTKEEVEKEVKYLPVLYNASKGDIEHFQSFVTKTRLSDLESIIEGMEEIKADVPPYPMEGPNSNMISWAAKQGYSDAFDKVLSYLKSLKQ